jgi:uncharacterized membrane protein YczE
MSFLQSKGGGTLRGKLGGNIGVGTLIAAFLLGLVLAFFVPGVAAVLMIFALALAIAQLICVCKRN